MNSQYGGTWYADGHTDFFQDDQDVFDAGSSEIASNNLWGQNGFANSFAGAKSSYYNNYGGTDPGVAKALDPVIALGSFNSRMWTTKNLDGLLDQLTANKFVNSFIEATSDARTVAGIMLPAGLGATRVVNQAKNGRETFMSVRSSINPINEINSIRNIAKIGKIADVAGKVLGVVAAVDHSIKAINDFKTET